MYAVALREPSADRVALLRLRASALERIGDYAAAAECWREIVVSIVDVDERNDAIFNEAHALLGGNEIAKGYARLNEALVARGEPRLGTGRLADLWNGAMFMLGPSSPVSPPPPPASPEVEARAFREMRLGQAIAYFDPLPGLRLMRRARALAEKQGAREATYFCDYLFAYLALFGERRDGPVKLYERYRARADATPGQRTLADNLAWPLFCDGIVALRDGRFDDAAARIDAALERMNEAGQIGSQSTMYILFARAEVEMWRQDVFAYERQCERVRAAIEESRTGTMRCQIEMSQAMILSMRGELEAANEVMEALARTWPSEVRTVQRMIIAMGLMMTTRATGDVSRARELAARYYGREDGFSAMDTIYAGLFLSTGALAEVGALRAGDPKASAARVRKYARHIPEGPPIARTAGLRALAYLDEHLGKPEEALKKLEEAEREALRVGHRLDAAYARYARGLRIGGDTGAALVLSARAATNAAGASDKVLDALGLLT
jgi:hypothetical protein